MPQIKPRSSMERRQFLKDVGVAGAAAVGSAAISNPPSVTADTVPSNRYMRSPENAPKYSRGPLPLPEVGIIALNRMGFGPRPGDLDDFNALGATDEERLNNYIEQQLDPDSIDDSVYEARQASAGFTTLSKSREQLWTEYLRGNQPTSLPMQELERLTFLRAIYSKKQLQEVLYDFWFNHFNVYGWQYAVSSMIRNYDRIIRTHMFGNFREMLEEITRSTTMLYYLDNYTNSREGPNENFARELFELHTLGAENYYGVMPQDDVPPDPSDPNLPAGYVDEDVYEATRCFTGWTVANSSNGPGGDTGLFLYRDDWHDRFQKRVLAYSNNIPSDQAAEQDGEDVLDMVAFHPGTARYICRKLCTRLISDNPPEQLVEDTAAFFMLHKDTGNQLKRVVRFILQSEAFRTTWGEKVKRPFEIIVGVMRATEADFTIRMDHSDSNTFLAYYDNIGQPPFSWPPPNGYPDNKEHWQSTSSMLMRWRMINWLVAERDENDNHYLDIFGQTPNGTRTANELADFWIQRLLSRTMSDYDRQQIVDLMAQGRNPDLDLPVNTDQDTYERLRAMVGAILMSPDFQWR